MSKCAHDYARCLSNPFTGPLACVPSYPAMMSLKTRSWSRGTFSTGTNGFGFVIVDPFRGGFNDSNSVSWSTSLYAGTTCSVGGTDVLFSNTNAQYQLSSLGDDPALLQARVVAAGLRIRYIGTELNRGGQKIGLMDPTHDSLDGRNISSANNELQSKVFPVSREWSTVLYRPVFDYELNYQQTSPPTNDEFYMGFLVQAASSATPLEYEFEFYVITEYQGRTVRGQTASHHDPVGFAAVNTTATTSKSLLPNSEKDTHREESFLGQVSRYVKDGVTSVTHFIESAEQAYEVGADIVSGGTKLLGKIEGLAKPILSITGI